MAIKGRRVLDIGYGEEEVPGSSIGIEPNNVSMNSAYTRYAA